MIYLTKFGKMLTEDAIMKVLQYEKEYTIPRFGKYGRIRPARIITDILVACALCIHIYKCDILEIHDIWSFVTFLLNVSTWFVLLTYLATRLVENKGLKMHYRSIMEVNREINTLLANKRDWSLFLMAGTNYGLIVLIALFSLYNNFDMHYLGLTATVPVAQEHLYLAVLKHLVAKRLRYIRSSDEYLERMEDTITHTRQLLECNGDLDNSYGLLTTTYVIFICQLILEYLYSFWIVLVAGIEENNFTQMFLILITIWTIAVSATPVLLATSSTFIVNEVEEIQLELDITLSARTCNEDQWTLVYLFLMELRHTPVQTSAMGFFDMTRSSVSSACATLTTYLLILIQYT